MSEKYKSRESFPEPKLFQVVLVPYRDGPRRCVVTQLFQDPDMIGTSEIQNEGTDAEILVIPGTSETASLELTEEVWVRNRVIDACTAHFISVAPNAREMVERMFPEKG